MDINISEVGTYHHLKDKDLDERRFCITSKGYTALAPRLPCVGDGMGTCRGEPAPVVLRIDPTGKVHYMESVRFLRRELLDCLSMRSEQRFYRRTETLPPCGV